MEKITTSKLVSKYYLPLKATQSNSLWIVFSHLSLRLIYLLFDKCLIK